jgi:hypothetical protein
MFTGAARRYSYQIALLDFRFPRLKRCAEPTLKCSCFGGLTKLNKSYQHRSTICQHVWDVASVQASGAFTDLLRLRAIAAQRTALQCLRERGEIGEEAFQQPWRGLRSSVGVLLGRRRRSLQVHP